MALYRIGGYASLFGIRDLAGDIVEKGAFANSLFQFPAPMVKMLYQHDKYRPIGGWDTIIEDDVGLWCEGFVDTSYNDALQIRSMLFDGTLTGLSIGFRTLDFVPHNGGRILKQIDLREISIVGFPMAPRARLKLLSPTFEIAA